MHVCRLFARGSPTPSTIPHETPYSDKRCHERVAALTDDSDGLRYPAAIGSASVHLIDDSVQTVEVKVSLHPDAPAEVIADPDKYATWRLEHMDAFDRKVTRRMSPEDVLEYFRAEWHGKAEDFAPPAPDRRKNSFGASLLQALAGRRS